VVVRDVLEEADMAAGAHVKALHPAVALVDTVIEVVITTVAVTMADVQAVTVIAATLVVAIMAGSVVR